MQSTSQLSSSHSESGDVVGEPEPAETFLRGDVVAAEGARRPLEHRGRCGVPLGDQHGQAVPEEIRRSRWLRRRWHGPRRLGDFQHTAAVGQTTDHDRGPQRVEVGLACERGVERLEPLGGLEQQRGRVAAASHREGDLRAEEVHAGAVEFVERSGLRRGQQSEGRVGRAGVVRGLRRGQRALRAARGLGRQFGRALQKGGGRRQAPARAAPGRPSAPARARRLRRGSPSRARGARRGDRDRRPDRSPPPAPGARSGDSARMPPGRSPSAPADGETAPARRPRADPPRTQVSPPRLRARAALRLATASPGRRRARPPRPAAAAASPAGAPRGAGGSSARYGLPGVARLDVRIRPAASSGCQPQRQLEQRERIAARLGDDPVAHFLVQRHPDGRGQQRPRIILTQTVDHQLREPGQRRAPRRPCGQRR